MKHILLSIFSLLLTISSTIAQTDEVYGITTRGGKYDAGTLFKLSESTDTNEVVHSFRYMEGLHPTAAPCLGRDQKLYGTTMRGGEDFKGNIYEYSPETDEFRTLYSFEEYDKGTTPGYDLLYSHDHRLYGTAVIGGTHYRGVLYEFDLHSEQYTILHHFHMDSIPWETYGQLCWSSDSLICGASSSHVWAYDIELDSFVVNMPVPHIYSQTPNLTASPDQKLYKIQRLEDSIVSQVVFEIDLETNELTEVTRISLDTLITYMHTTPVWKDNKLYGVVSGHNKTNQSQIFQYDFAQQELTLLNDTHVSFHRSLVVTTNGQLVGLTSGDGDDEHGTISSFDIATQEYKVLHSFENKKKYNEIHGRLMIDPFDRIYGSLTYYGDYNSGLCFHFNTDQNTYSKLLDFSGDVGEIGPDSKLFQHVNGKLYGEISIALNRAQLFEFDPRSLEYRIAHDLENHRDKFLATYVFSDDGKIFSTSFKTGQYDLGEIYLVDPDQNSLMKVADIPTVNDTYHIAEIYTLQSIGNDQYLALTQLLGSMVPGYAIIKLDLNTQSMEVVLDFATDTNLGSSKPSFDKTSSGEFYGTMTRGVDLLKGLIYQYDPIANEASIAKAFDDSTSGRTPYRGLHELNGKLYGTSVYGNDGTGPAIFEFAPSNNELKTILSLGDSINSFNLQMTSLGDLLHIRHFADEEKLLSYDIASENTQGSFSFSGSNGRDLIGLTSIDRCQGVQLTMEDQGLSVEPKGLSYQWLNYANFNPEIPGATSEIYTPTTNGTYAVIVEYVGGTCHSNRQDVVIIGKEQLQKTDFSVYPNPTNDIVYVSSKLENSATLRVFNNLGQEMTQQNIFNNKLKVDTSNWPSGIYFFELETENGDIRKKIIKE